MDMNFQWTTRDEKLLVVAYWWEQQKGLCCICGKEMEPYKRQSSHHPRAATVEHLIPKRDGGPNTAGNVRLAHALCNHTLGAIWEENQHRIKLGFPPIGAEEAISRPKKRQQKGEALPRFNKRCHYPKESLHYPAWIKWLDEQAAKKKRGVAWCALNAVSLPRGATLLPQYKGLVEAQLKSRVARKMTAEETAHWLAKQGIRGA
jgi:HNH endonuclease